MHTHMIMHTELGNDENLMHTDVIRELFLWKYSPQNRKKQQLKTAEKFKEKLYKTLL